MIIFLFVHSSIINILQFMEVFHLTSKDYNKYKKSIDLDKYQSKGNFVIFSGATQSIFQLIIGNIITSGNAPIISEWSKQEAS